jgi:hypothetical protein
MKLSKDKENHITPVSCKSKTYQSTLLKPIFSTVRHLKAYTSAERDATNI